MSAFPSADEDWSTGPKQDGGRVVVGVVLASLPWVLLLSLILSLMIDVLT